VDSDVLADFIHRIENRISSANRLISQTASVTGIISNSILVPGTTLANTPNIETDFRTSASALTQWKLSLSIHNRPCIPVRTLAVLFGGW